jgi:hypothetical protein
MARTALDFYEDDEDPAELLAIFDAGEKGLTSSTTVIPYVEWRET